MTKMIASLKLDFKIDERGIVRIIDLGDGLSAGTAGFEDTPLDSQMLSDIHEATGASIATLFGELPKDAMRPNSLHVPIVFRPPASTGQSYNTKDLPAKYVLPYSYCGRFSSFLSSAWKDKKDLVLVAPVGLLATEMHKILWYFIIEKHMAAEEQQKTLYWSNTIKPTEINLDGMDLRHGVFIKIGDRSDGGGEGVYYAKNKYELLAITAKLYKKYLTSDEPFKKHVYIIEPAFVTLKKHEDKEYNVTGRAFVNIVYDQDEQTVEVKIAAAKWMFPEESFTEGHSEAQMLSNVKHSIKMLNLTAEELESLSTGVQKTYSEIFKAGFKNDDLLLYCHDHPYIKYLTTSLRPNAAYLLSLKTFYASG